MWPDYPPALFFYLNKIKNTTFICKLAETEQIKSGYK